VLSPLEESEGAPTIGNTRECLTRVLLRGAAAILGKKPSLGGAEKLEHKELLIYSSQSKKVPRGLYVNIYHLKCPLSKRPPHYTYIPERL